MAPMRQQHLPLVLLLLAVASTGLQGGALAQGPLGDYMGCYTDNVVNGARMLPTDLGDLPDMRPALCAQMARAAGLAYYAVQTGSHCFGGNDFRRATSLGPSSGCSTACPGNANEICGGPLANSVYSLGSVGDYLGCYTDNNARTLPLLLGQDLPNMSPALCAQMARGAGLRYYAVQYGRWCFGGNDIKRATILGQSSGCNTACSGNANEICGGPLANSVYSFDSVGDYLGCYADDNTRMLPIYLGQDLPNMSPALCASMARAAGLMYYAVQYGRWCFGGNGFGRAISLGQSSKCNTACSGNANEICGGPLANSVYSLDSVGDYLGCYTDNNARTLPLLLGQDLPNMRRALCAQMARAAGLMYYAVQYGRWCFGGNDLQRATSLGQSSCNVTCSGNANELCGGPLANSVHSLVGNGRTCPPASNGYTLSLDVDHGGDDISCGPLVSVNAAFACTANPLCKAFSIWFGGDRTPYACVKATAGPLAPRAGVCFYTKV